MNTDTITDFEIIDDSQDDQAAPAPLLLLALFKVAGIQ